MSNTLSLAHAGYRRSLDVVPDAGFATALSERLPVIAECRGRRRWPGKDDRLGRPVVYVAVPARTRLARPLDLATLWIETTWPLFAFEADGQRRGEPRSLSRAAGAR